jgi:hypothetical protein
MTDTARQAHRLCTRYAAKMESVKDLPLRHAEEWDFRSITEAELQYATEYEYVRESAPLRCAIVKFLQRKLQGTPVRIHLLEGRELEYGGPVGQTTELADANPLFPLPWLAMVREDCIELADSLRSFNRNPIRILEIDKPIGRHLHSMPDGYWLRIRFGKPIEEIVQNFENWLRKEARKHQPAPRGKAARRKDEKLRWLAALRLHKAGLSWERAQKHIQTHLKREPINPTLDVIPNFASSGGWSGALQSAREELSRIEAQYPIYFPALCLE